MRSIRPGHGLAPKHYDKVIGKIAKGDIEFGEPLSLDMIKGSSFNVRGVKRGDSKRIWEIRSHPASQKYSHTFNTPFEQHNLWFEKKYFLDSENYCYVLENEKSIIGYCRFDINTKNNNYFVSIAVDPDYHNKGLGHKLLSESLKEIITEKDIVAEVPKINISSIKLFKKNNFKECMEDEENYYLKYNL